MAAKRTRMSASERREQLIAVARGLFAERGFDATSVEEVAARAQVSKPVVYEHFGGKEGLYAVVVDRESRVLHDAIRSSLTVEHASFRELIERGAMALLDYIDAEPDGFRILARDSSVGSSGGSFASILSDIATKVEDLLARPFERAGYDPAFANLYAQALTGLVAMAGGGGCTAPVLPNCPARSTLRDARTIPGPVEWVRRSSPWAAATFPGWSAGRARLTLNQDKRRRFDSYPGSKSCHTQLMTSPDRGGTASRDSTRVGSAQSRTRSGCVEPELRKP